VRNTYNLVSEGIRHVVNEAGRLKGWGREEIVEAEPTFRGQL
jgi:hypothetical protein